MRLDASVLAALVAAAAGCAGCATSHRAVASRPASQEPAVHADIEPFELDDVQGHRWRLADHLGREVILVSFWATWCSPCKVELDRMAAVYDRLAPRGFTYVAISTDEPAAAGAVRSLVRTAGYRFPVLRDPQSEVMRRLNPRGDLPFALLIDRTGHVVRVFQGFSAGDEITWERLVRRLLATQPAGDAKRQRRTPGTQP